MDGPKEELAMDHVHLEEQNIRSQYEAAVGEWDRLPEVQCTDSQESTLFSQSAATSDVSYTEMWAYFKVKDLKVHMNDIHPTVEKKGRFRSILCRLLGPPQLDRRLVPERDRIFAIAQCQLESDEPLQIQMLTTIYKRLTSTRLACTRFGHHWETIGFQGSDPATDLRGVGLLGPLNTLFLLSANNHRLAAEAYRLSLQSQQNFPFMVLSINITRLTLNALRHGVLNRECNQRLVVMDVFNEYYVCLMCEFYRIWKNQKKTIVDSGNVLKDLEIQSLKKYRYLRHGLRVYLTQPESRQVVTIQQEGSGDTN